MVRSLYILNYFENMKKWYKEQGIIFDNWNDDSLTRRDDGYLPGRDLFYVPKNQSEHMVDELVRYSLVRNIKDPGESWIYLGWNVSATDALSGTRSHITHRVIPPQSAENVRVPPNLPAGSRLSKWFREGVWDLSVFMVTNKGNIAEDLEEIYESRIQMKSEYTVDMGSIFMFDYPDWKINTQHRTVQTSNPMTQKGNLWAVSYNVTLTGPSIELSETHMAACKSISVTLYNMASGNILEEIIKED